MAGGRGAEAELGAGGRAAGAQLTFATATALDEHRRATTDVHGRAGAVTAIIATRPGWRLWLALVFFVGTRTDALIKPLVRLGIINVGRWALIRRIPGGPGVRPRRLPRTYLLFESNFNGMFAPYIEHLSRVLTFQWGSLWGGCYAWPGKRPAADLLEFIDHHHHPAAHYFCAYPEASTRMVVSALELSRRFQVFTTQGRGRDDERLAALWERFVTDAQDLL